LTEDVLAPREGLFNRVGWFVGSLIAWLLG